MRRFVLKENLERYRKLLADETRESRRQTLRSLFCSAQRELALVESASSHIGARSGVPAPANRDDYSISRFQSDFENSQCPYLVLDPRTGLRIVDINDAYAGVTMTTRVGVPGERLFDVFPDNPDDLFADGVSSLYASLMTAAETGRPHAMPIQRYDIRDPSGKFVVRYWRASNTPLFDDKGRLVYLLIHAEDVTSDVLTSARFRALKTGGGAAQSHAACLPEAERRDCPAIRANGWGAHQSTSWFAGLPIQRACGGTEK